jgi:hypothetical protein
LHHGQNSGYQALHLAVHFAAKRILLLGYDMHAPLVNERAERRTGSATTRGKRARTSIGRCCRTSTACRAAGGAGVAVINCTPGSALQDLPAQHDRAGARQGGGVKAWVEIRDRPQYRLEAFEAGLKACGYHCTRASCLTRRLARATCW